MDSRTYWRKREEQWIKEQIRNDIELKKKINELMSDAFDEVQQDIDSFYAKYATAEGISIAEARKRVANHDVQKFAKKAKKYVEDKDFSPRANEELRLYNLTMKVNRLELLKAKINLVVTGSADEVDKLVADDTYDRVIAELERNAGILGSSTHFDVEQRAWQIITGSYKLKGDETMNTFSDNIWLYKDELVKDIEKLLISNFTKGDNPRVMARQLKDKFNVFGYQAERLARTESSRIQSEVQEQSYTDNGIDEYEWIAEPSACKACSALDGKIFKVKDAKIGINMPAIHPNDRCSTSPHTDPNTMYRDWLKRGIITQEEYNTQIDFRKDYDSKFEKLMEKRNEHEASMSKKRRDRLPTDHIDKNKR